MDSDRNIYREDVKFTELAFFDTDFAKLYSVSLLSSLKSNGQLDFSDPAAVQQLTRSLLKRDFNLDLSLPLDRLCPPVPNRFNYILWIQELLDTTSLSYLDKYDHRREVTGLDIGTGASCIYPLLGCAQRPQWRFVATDIDDHSLQYAQANITANNLSSRIKVLKTTLLDPLIPLDIFGLEAIDFTICNPPFYSTPDELLSSAIRKSRPPNSACTGTITEMVYQPDGEIGFVSRMITESLHLRTRVQWYTSMLGKLSSVPVIVGELKEAGVNNWAIAEFVQGSRTKRWGVAWSYSGKRPALRVARAVGGASGVERKWLPFGGEWAWEGLGNVEGMGRKVDRLMNELPLRWMWKANISNGVGFAKENVWSRAARRKRLRDVRKQEVDGDDGKEEDDVEEEEDEEEAFGFKIIVRLKDNGTSVMTDEKGEGNERRIEVVVRWLEGFDSALFESFCGMIKRKLEE